MVYVHCEVSSGEDNQCTCICWSKKNIIPNLPLPFSVEPLLKKKTFLGTPYEEFIMMSLYFIPSTIKSYQALAPNLDQTELLCLRKMYFFNSSAVGLQLVRDEYQLRCLKY